MKALHILVIFAAVTAFALLPFVLEITASLLFAGAFVGLAMADYSRTRPHLRFPGTATLSVASRAERFGLAA